MTSETHDVSPADTDATEVPWLNEAEQLAWRGWIDASRRVLAATDRQLKRDAGLTTDDYEVFVRLSEADGHRLRMSDLASSVTNSPSRLSQRIDRLSRDGFVARARCETDARVWWVELTDTGRDKLEATAPGHVAAVREAFVDRLSRDEIEVLAMVLPRLATSLENSGARLRG
ncbi:MAG: MarR family transcriptional regulator [Actinomycetota bacterium]